MIRRLTNSLIILLLIVGCASIGGKIGAAAGRKAAIKSQKLALESQKLALEIVKYLNEIDTTIKYSDELPNKIKIETDRFIKTLYEEIDNALLPFINPNSFIIDLK